MSNADAKIVLDRYDVKREILIPDEEIKTIYRNMKGNSISRKGENRRQWICFGLMELEAFREWIRRHCSRCMVTGIKYSSLKIVGSGLSVDR